MIAPLAESWLARSAPVAAAQAAGRPVVALESTIIAHGMPYPENVRTAREVEGIIRELGSEPATIAVIGGRIRIGLSDEELELLGRSGQAQKVSRRDLPAVLASGGLGATTVAGKMKIVGHGTLQGRRHVSPAQPPRARSRRARRTH